MNFRKGDEMTGSDMTQSSHLSKCRSRSDSFLRDTSSRAVSEVWKGAPLVQSRHTVLPSPLCSSSFAWAVFRPGSNPFASLRAISESRQRFFGFLLQHFPTFIPCLEVVISLERFLHCSWLCPCRRLAYLSLPSVCVTPLSLRAFCKTLRISMFYIYISHI